MKLIAPVLWKYIALFLNVQIGFRKFELLTPLLRLTKVRCLIFDVTVK